MFIAFKGCESTPRSNAWISGDEMNNLYRESWKSDSPQNTTCSYLTGTINGSQGMRKETTVLQRTVFGKKIIRSANDELGNRLTKLL